MSIVSTLLRTILNGALSEVLRRATGSRRRRRPTGLSETVLREVVKAAKPSKRQVRRKRSTASSRRYTD
ncbi:MAG: hypothetical protein INR68_13000 [Methylobacterium mesophilicum]|nr:hypothetical protein [Methylobacterium mesophilicum]